MRLQSREGDRTVSIDVVEEGGRIKVSLDGESLPMDVRELSPGVYSLLHGAVSFEVRVREEATGEAGVSRMVVDLYDDEYVVELADPRRLASGGGAAAAGRGAQKVLAPMHGKVVRVLVARGASVARGQGILVMEAMKMENELKATIEGTLAELKCAPGDSFTMGALLAVVEPA